MPAAIIAGLPPDIERRVRGSLRDQPSLNDNWTIVWIRSKSRTPGLAPSQLADVLQRASELDGAHVLALRGRDHQEEMRVAVDVAPYFRLRWIDKHLLALIPHAIHEFIDAIAAILKEELEWSLTVKPRDEACCLLLPECAFVADDTVRHLWAVAAQGGLERIRSAVRVAEKFESAHWRVHELRGDERERA